MRMNIHEDYDEFDYTTDHFTWRQWWSAQNCHGKCGYCLIGGGCNRGWRWPRKNWKYYRENQYKTVTIKQ